MTGTDTDIQIPGYKIIKPLGYGGMATVYLAIQESIGREVAIKVMSPALASDPSFSERFVKEARMANLSHPHIITVYDAGVSSGQNYIVMELAAGGNLDTAIQHGLSAARVVEIIKAIASALHYSCNKGFIHRDVKPENILFKEDGSALLVDFGIAKAITAATRLTMVGSTIGSPNYMSPEQARGLALDGRSDLYSLGIVFYEALTGIKPYDASDTYVIGLKHISDPIPQLPVEFEKFQPIINKLLAKDARERFEDGTALVETLDKIQLDDIDYTIIPHAEQSRAAAPTEVEISEDDTRLSPDFGERETVVTDAVEKEKKSSPTDATIVIADTTRQMDKTVEDEGATQLMPEAMPDGDDATRVLSAAAEEKSGKGGIVATVGVAVLAIGGFIAWQMTSKPDAPTPVVTPEKIVKEKQTPEIKEKPVEKEIEVIKAKPVIEPVDKESPAIDQTEQEIQDYLAQAEIYFSKKQFTSPKTKNAFFMYNKVLELDPENFSALDGLNSIADKYYGYAKPRFDKKQYKKAESFIKKGLKVAPEHQALLELQQAIADAKEKESIPRPEQIAKQIPKSKLKANQGVLRVAGNHASQSLAENEYQSKNNLSNKIYYLGLSQCNQSTAMFESEECRDIYQRLIRQWPLALKTGAYSESESTQIKRGKLTFNKTETRKMYQEHQSAYLKQMGRPGDRIKSDKDSRTALANAMLFTPVTPLLDIETPGNLQALWRKSIKQARDDSPTIKNKADLLKRVKQLLETRRVNIKPFVNKRSFEITPFASALHQSISRNFGNRDVEKAKYQLRGEYAIDMNGDILLDLWLFNEFNEVIGLENLKLDKAIRAGHRISNIFYNEDIFPSLPLTQSYGFPADVKIGESSSNALLLVGEETNLQVKLDNPGFYFIAVHVVRENEQFSYLLPLRQGNVPFVQVTLRNQRYQHISLGKFNITPPTGVETIQLIASGINLEKYLPPYKWSEKRQQYVISGSEGDISKGISQVRKKMNTISETAHDKSVQWQERLLVTTILQKADL